MKIPGFILNFYTDYLGPLVNWLKGPEDDPKGLPFRWVINFQKGGTALWVLGNMYYHNHWGQTAYTYLALHGTYGALWLMKDMIFPDPGWEMRVNIVRFINAFVSVLGPYWFFAWTLCQNHVEVSSALQAFCISWHTLGCVLMMASDTQKYFVLKVKKGLISDGWFTSCRNTNYLGEMMLYSTYAILSQSAISWCILLYVWIMLFGSNICYKEKSLMNKPGYDEYESRSGLIIPSLTIPRYYEASKKASQEKGGYNLRSKDK